MIRSYERVSDHAPIVDLPGSRAYCSPLADINPLDLQTALRNMRRQCVASIVKEAGTSTDIRDFGRRGLAHVDSSRTSSS